MQQIPHFADSHVDTGTHRLAREVILPGFTRPDGAVRSLRLGVFPIHRTRGQARHYLRFVERGARKNDRCTGTGRHVCNEQCKRRLAATGRAANAEHGGRAQTSCQQAIERFDAGGRRQPHGTHTRRHVDLHCGQCHRQSWRLEFVRTGGCHVAQPFQCLCDRYGDVLKQRASP